VCLSYRVERRSRPSSCAAAVDLKAQISFHAVRRVPSVEGTRGEQRCAAFSSARTRPCPLSAWLRWPRLDALSSLAATMSASKRPRSRPPMSGARVREARRAKSWERAERSEESALSEPRCEQSDERSESCECVSAPRSTTCCASCGKVCASGVVEHTTDDGDTREAAGELLCETTLSSLDAAIVTRRRRRMTSFAFPSGGAPTGASLLLRRPLRRRRPGTEYADCTYGSDCADCGRARLGHHLRRRRG